MILEGELLELSLALWCAAEDGCCDARSIAPRLGSLLMALGLSEPPCRLVNRETKRMRICASAIKRLELLCGVYRRICNGARQWEQVQGSKNCGPYLRYVAPSPHPGSQHLDWSGTVLHANDTWWQRYYPPNGWSCECHAETLTADEIARHGYSISRLAPAFHSCPVVSPFNGAAIQMPEGIEFGFVGVPSFAMAQRLTLLCFDHPEFVARSG